MIDAPEVKTILDEGKISDTDWIGFAEKEASDIIRNQAKKNKTTIFFVVRKPKSHPSHLNAIFYDYSKMTLICDKLKDRKFFVDSGDFILRISLYDIFDKDSKDDFKARIEDKAKKFREKRDKQK